MKRNSNIKYILTGSALLLFGLLSLIVFLTVPEERLDYSVFRLAFSFSIPFNFVALTVMILWGFERAERQLARLPMVLFVSGIFTAIYLVAGLIFMYLPIEEITFPLILFVSVTVLYVIAAALSMHGAGYISSTEKEVKDKRLFIKLLEADVLDCMEKASEESSKDLLKRLAEDIKYSDPMSHPSLMGIEAELSATVGNISLQLSEDPAKDVTSSVSKAQTLLKSRNNRCIMLK